MAGPRRGGARSAALVAIALVVASSASAQAPALRGDGIAAIVGGNTPEPGVAVILRSDVDLRARIRVTGERSAPYLGELPTALLRATLEELVGEMLIAREAERVQVATASRRDLEEERRRLAQQAGGPDRLRALAQRMGVTDEELEAIAARRALVKVFLEANLQGETEVDDATLERVFESGEHPFLGQELDDVREPMRVWIVRTRLASAVERWVSVLRARTTVRVIAAY